VTTDGAGGSIELHDRGMSGAARGYVCEARVTAADGARAQFQAITRQSLSIGSRSTVHFAIRPPGSPEVPPPPAAESGVVRPPSHGGSKLLDTTTPGPAGAVASACCTTVSHPCRAATRVPTVAPRAARVDGDMVPRAASTSPSSK
jgi:hypothetical protein